jgi:ATP-binding cassette subfamily B protein
MPHPTGTTPAVLLRALRLWRPYARTGLLLALCLLLQQGFTTYFSLSLKRVVDHAAGRQAGTLSPLLLSLTAFFLISAGASLLGDLLTARVSASILRDLRLEMFAHLQGLSPGFYERARAGDVAARFTSDLADIEKGLAERIPDGLCALLGLALNLPLLFLLDLRLALLSCLSLPLVYLGPRLLSPRAVAATFRRKQEEAALQGLLHEQVRAQPAIQAFSLQGLVRALFSQRLAALVQSSVRAEFLGALVAQTSSIGVLLLQVVVIGAGAYLALAGALSPGTLVAVMSLLSQITRDAYTLSKKVAPSLLKAAGGLRRVDELLAERPEVGERPGAPPLPRLSAALRFSGVDFSYEGDAASHPAVSGLSFTIAAGQRVAFVGPSGSGKSTVLRLILRFHDPAAGALTLDGHDLRDVSLSSLRAQIGVMFQDAFLLHLSIRENIRLGRPEASDQDVEAAARAAEIHEQVLRLPRGYDTLAGEMGGLLSGGQRQRIALARAILRDPVLLLLDEATAALDPETEGQVLATLERLSRGRTVISVTHRLASARGADRIFVMDRGRLVEEGRHEELLERGGLYAQLWQAQHQGQGRDARG